VSKIAKKPIAIAAGATVKVEGGQIEIKGPKGTLKRAVPAGLKAVVKDNAITIERTAEDKQTLISHGSLRSHVANMMTGVTTGFTRVLLLEGVGYRAQAGKDGVQLALGFSHPVLYPVPAGIKVETPEPTRVIVTGIDKDMVGKVAAELRRLKLPEPYKGKGFRYEGEKIKRKAGKAITK